MENVKSESESNDEGDQGGEEHLAELVVTLDPLTTGFLSDLQLIVQLAIDKTSYKCKVGVQTAYSFVATTMTSVNLRDMFTNAKSCRDMT